MDWIGRCLGKYRIEEHLGTGGMAQVFRARDTRLGRVVALKIPTWEDQVEDAMLVRRFWRECRALARLSHPNVIQIFDADTDPELGVHFYAMPLLLDPTLEQMLRQSHSEGVGLLAAPAAIRITASLLAGLEELHIHGLVHRDVKPSNIFVSQEGDAVLADLGLVKSSTLVSQLEGVRLMGTVEYMAPEQLAMKDTDHRTDIYQAGLVLYRMLAGRLPFPNELGAAIAAKLLSPGLSLPAELCRGVEPALEDVVLRACSREPASRFQSASGMRQALDDAARTVCGSQIETIRGAAGAVPPPARPRRTTVRESAVSSAPRISGPRPRGVRLLVAAGVVVMAIATGVLMRPDDRRTEPVGVASVALPSTPRPPDVRVWAGPTFSAVLVRGVAGHLRIECTPANDLPARAGHRGNLSRLPVKSTRPDRSGWYLSWLSGLGPGEAAHVEVKTETGQLLGRFRLQQPLVARDTEALGREPPGPRWPVEQKLMDLPYSLLDSNDRFGLPWQYLPVEALPDDLALDGERFPHVLVGSAAALLSKTGGPSVCYLREEHSPDARPARSAPRATGNVNVKVLSGAEFGAVCKAAEQGFTAPALPDIAGWVLDSAPFGERSPRSQPGLLSSWAGHGSLVAVRVRAVPRTPIIRDVRAGWGYWRDWMQTAVRLRFLGARVVFFQYPRHAQVPFVALGYFHPAVFIYKHHPEAWGLRLLSSILGQMSPRSPGRRFRLVGRGQAELYGFEIAGAAAAVAWSGGDGTTLRIDPEDDIEAKFDKPPLVAGGPVPAGATADPSESVYIWLELGPTPWGPGVPRHGLVVQGEDLPLPPDGVPIFVVPVACALTPARLTPPPRRAPAALKP